VCVTTCLFFSLALLYGAWKVGAKRCVGLTFTVDNPSADMRRPRRRSSRTRRSADRFLPKLEAEAIPAVAIVYRVLLLSGSCEFGRQLFETKLYHLPGCFTLGCARNSKFRQIIRSSPWICIFGGQNKFEKCSARHAHVDCKEAVASGHISRMGGCPLDRRGPAPRDWKSARAHAERKVVCALAFSLSPSPWCLQTIDTRTLHPLVDRP